ncbi:MAG: RNA methyltransferase [Halieaceae bacterium]|jgi:23S rRNA (guanosine2251-2'-O)-methyltransferase|nr:RNA methyltransferase [Halieaceae bacterium]
MATPEPTAPQRSERRRFLTVYGRNAVLEALSDPDLDCRTLHLASSNRQGGILAEITRRAAEREVSLREHSREELARISRNGRQDQGVALDVFCPRIGELDAARAAHEESCRLVALDGVTNPQNMGMVLRSCVAAGIDGILYADRGNPRLGPLVIKASAGTAFRAPLLRCTTVQGGLEALLDAGFSLFRLSADGERTLFDGRDFPAHSVFVLGGESDGISAGIRALPGTGLSIPMASGVESLNVAVSAALVAYRVAQSQIRSPQRDR